MHKVLSSLLFGVFLVCVALAVASLPADRKIEPDTLSLTSHGELIRVSHFPATGSAAGSTAVLLVPGWPAVGGDILGMASGLSRKGLHVFVLQPRGHGDSTGRATFAGALEDVAVAWNWLASENGGRALGVDPRNRVMAGYSWGGGIALAFAAARPSVRRVASIAGSDHGAFIRRFDREPEYAAALRRALLTTQAPAGPVNFDLEETLDELRANRADHDLVSLAPRLLDRDILLVAGWDDGEVEIEFQVLPFYRALRAGRAASVRIIAFQDGHGFRHSREALVEKIAGWVS